MANIEAKSEGTPKKARKNGPNKTAAISLKEIFEEDDT